MGLTGQTSGKGWGMREEAVQWPEARGGGGSRCLHRCFGIELMGCIPNERGQRQGAWEDCHGE